MEVPGEEPDGVDLDPALAWRRERAERLLSSLGEPARTGARVLTASCPGERRHRLATVYRVRGELIVHTRPWWPARVVVRTAQGLRLRHALVTPEDRTDQLTLPSSSYETPDQVAAACSCGFVLVPVPWLLEHATSPSARPGHRVVVPGVPRRRYLAEDGRAESLVANLGLPDERTGDGGRDDEDDYQDAASAS